MQDPNAVTSFVEIVKRPGQTLGLYIREGNGLDRHDGVFISRIAIDSAVYSSGCLQLGDEILAVNLVDVTRMSLDDVVIIMSIPRRLVLTTRRTRNGPRGVSAGNNGGAPLPFGGPRPENGNLYDGGGKTTPPVVVFKGGRGGGGGGDYYDGVDSPRRDYMPYRDARTLTWDRNPKPDRSDPKYFPVNSLPRQNSGPPTGPGSFPPNPGRMGELGTPGGGSAGGGAPDGYGEMGMPPPMRELSTGYPPIVTTNRAEENRYQQQQQQGYFSPSNEYYGTESDSGGGGGGGGSGVISAPGRGQRLLQRMASEPSRYRGAAAAAAARQQSMQSPTANMTNGRRSYTLQYANGGGGGGGGGRHGYVRGGSIPGGRSRHYSGLDYASDTEALHSPSGSGVGSSMRVSRGMSRNVSASGAPVTARSSSLPRTFQREALLRHPELSMEMDRLADPAVLSGLSTDDQLSDSGAVSAPESVVTARKRGEILRTVKPRSCKSVRHYTLIHSRPCFNSQSQLKQLKISS